MQLDDFSRMQPTRNHPKFKKLKTDRKCVSLG